MTCRYLIQERNIKMDKITLEKLNYFELKEIVKGYCISGLGKALIDKLEPSCK